MGASAGLQWHAADARGVLANLSNRFGLNLTPTRAQADKLVDEQLAAPMAAHFLWQRGSSADYDALLLDERPQAGHCGERPRGEVPIGAPFACTSPHSHTRTVRVTIVPLSGLLSLTSSSWQAGGWCISGGSYVGRGGGGGAITTGGGASICGPPIGGIGPSSLTCANATELQAIAAAPKVAMAENFIASSRYDFK
jgi:hypothetical protein